MERKLAAGFAAQAIVDLVTAAHRGMTAAYDSVRVGIVELAADHPVRPAELGNALGLPPSTVTRHVQHLEDAGHVIVRQDVTDRRTCRVEATAEGRADIARTREVGAQVFAEVTADWSVADIEMLTELADRLRADWATRAAAARRRPTRGPQPRWRHAPDAEPSGHRDTPDTGPINDQEVSQ